MVEKIKGIEVKGKSYADRRKFDLFGKADADSKAENRVTLLYGRNGSGKSTLAAAFKSVDPACADGQLEVSILKDDGSTVPAANCDEALKKAIAVFDEKYVDAKVRLRPDARGIGTIVLFSDLIDIDDQIESATKEKGEADNAEARAKTELESYNDAKNIRSPQYHLDRATEIMKGAWAEKTRILRGLSRKPSVPESTVHETGKLTCRTASKDLQAEITRCENDLGSLERIGDVASIPPVAQLTLGGFDEAAFLDLLNRHVDEPELGDREKRIMGILKRAREERILEIKGTFSDPSATFCPYCFRDIAGSEKIDLVESIERVLNKEVENYKQSLASVRFPSFSFDYDRYQVVDPDSAREAREAVEKCVGIVNGYQEDIASKSGNVYGVSTFQRRGLTDAVAAANERLKTMEAKRASVSALAKRKEEIKKELVRLYAEEAHYGMEKAYAAYERQEAEKAAKEKECADLKTKVDALQSKIDGLKSKKAGTDIAVECINDYLRYIFAATGRFTVEPKDGEYVLKSRGRDVRPADVSTGERHILALAYFFVDIMANHQKKDFFKDERLLVIDDPVSSYDQENRVGVYSFLMRVMRQVLCGNNSSRILLMTHDLYTVIGLMQAIEMINAPCPGIDNFIVRCLELWPDGLKDFRLNKRNEYGLLLNDVYQFAKDKSAPVALTVGNEMRRVLEAYSSFLYRIKFTDLCGGDFTSRLDGLGPYLMSRIDRLVLHDESHMEGRARSIAADGTFFAVISEDEKQQTAQDVLCLLYVLDPLHVMRHFQTCGQDGSAARAEKDIKAWIQERKGKLAKADATQPSDRK